MLELNAVYLLLAVLIVVVATEKWRVMPFVAIVVATGFYGLAQGGSPPWNAGEFATGAGQAVANAGLAIVLMAMLAQAAMAAGAGAWLTARLTGRGRLGGVAVLAAVAGLGGNPTSALAVLMPVMRAAGGARARLALSATALVNACHGTVVPSPLPIAALAILGGDWRLALPIGLGVALIQALVGLALARRAPAMAEPVEMGVEGSARAGLGLVLITLVLIGLILCQSLGQIPSEPLGGGSTRESLLGLGRPMILAWVVIGGALLLFARRGRPLLGEEGPFADGARGAVGLLLAVAAAGGFQMILHNSGMSVVVAGWVPRLGEGIPSALALAVPFLIALVSRAMQGSALTATIAAAGMMQPLLAPLGLDGEAGRALAALAVGAGAMAVPHVNDGYFWLAGHLAGLRPLEGLRRVTGAALLQGLAGLAVLIGLAGVLT